MNAIAVERPRDGRAKKRWPRNTIHLRDDIPPPSLDECEDGRGVELRILQVGLCGTDREINAGDYGEPPPGCRYLILGHECLAQVSRVGANVSSFRPGDIVAPTVRRPGGDEYSRIRYQDLTPEDVYLERGISELHGFLCETAVEHEEFLVKVDSRISDVGVLMEPMSVVQKALRAAWRIQEARLPFFRPKRALVAGAGPVGQLALCVLRLRGLDVTVVASRPAERNRLKSELVERVGGRYVSTGGRSLPDVLKNERRFDIVLDATGSSIVAFEAAHVCWERMASASGLRLRAGPGQTRSARMRSTRRPCSGIKCSLVQSTPTWRTSRAARGIFIALRRFIPDGSSEFCPIGWGIVSSARTRHLSTAPAGAARSHAPPPGAG